ncbi:MAG: hypothetical protein Tsb005_19030 [Gammaproteobacteria bacterium]
MSYTHMTLRLKPHEKQVLDEMAQQLDITPTHCLRRIVQDALARYHENPTTEADKTAPIWSERIAKKQLSFLLEMRFLLRHLAAQVDPQLLAKCVENANEGVDILLNGHAEKASSSL